MNASKANTPITKADHLKTDHAIFFSFALLIFILLAPEMGSRKYLGELCVGAHQWLLTLYAHVPLVLDQTLPTEISLADLAQWLLPASLANPQFQ
jgi:hypothetical protein